MDPSFWIDRWAEGRIGFHQAQVHPDLITHAQRLLKAPKQRILVPLCGKTRDLLWFAEHCHTVVGVDLSELAFEQWTAENTEAPPEVLERVRFQCGDILEFDPGSLGHFDLIWDRAALVALDPERRKRYANGLRALIKPGGQLLINSFEYDQSQMAGPPYSVPQQAVQDLFPNWEWKLLRLGDWQTEGKFRQRGVSQFREFLGLLKA